MKLHYSLDLLSNAAWAVYALGQILFHGLDAPIVERALLALLHYSALDLLVVLALDEKTPAAALGAAIVAGAWSLFYFYAGSYLQAPTGIPLCAIFASLGITLLKQYPKRSPLTSVAAPHKLTAKMARFAKKSGAGGAT